METSLNDAGLSSENSGGSADEKRNQSQLVDSANKNFYSSNNQHSFNSCTKLLMTKKAKRIRFFRNGDKYYNGLVLAVTPEKYRSFDSLISDLTRALITNVTLPNGVRIIYTMEGKKVQDIDELEDGKSYIASGKGEVFKRIDYSSNTVKRGSSLSGLPSSTINSSKHINSIPNFIKAKIITLIRNGIKPRKIVRLLLNKRNSASMDHVLEAITEVIKLDSGAARKVYGLLGQQIITLEQFFDKDDIFIVYGNEKPSLEDFDLDAEELKYVQNFRKGYSNKKHSGPVPKMPSRKLEKRLSITSITESQSSLALNLPELLDIQYSIGKIIGDGNFAVVRECLHKPSGICYAVKIIDKLKCQGKETMLTREVSILRQVCHPNIISLIQDQETDSHLFLVMELIKGGDLFDAIAMATKFSEADASTMITHLCSALSYLHSNNIVHRDVKPENLLVQTIGDHIHCLKLADFGLAQIIYEPLYTICGTPTYVAPEILAEIGYGLKIDVWAAGVILYILLCGFPPFVSTDNEQEKLFERILSAHYEFPSPYWDNVSQTAKELVSNMLQAQPELRFSAEDVLDHAWSIKLNDRGEYHSSAAFGQTPKMKNSKN